MTIVRGAGRRHKPSGTREVEEMFMAHQFRLTTTRRKFLTASAVVGGLQFTGPAIIKARGETPVKIGFIDPITGSLSALAATEVEAAKWTVEQMNKKGGILGRQVQLLVEDSTSADTGTAVQKARKLIERDKVDFLLGNVNSAMALGGGLARPGVRFELP